MNDKFLKTYRIKPRSAFTQELQSRLNINEKMVQPMGHTQLRPIIFGMATCLLVLVLMIVVLPSARAQVEDWVEQVGNLVFSAAGDYPGREKEVITVQEDRVTLAEARAQLSFPIDIPSWVPEGYVMQEEIFIAHFMGPVKMVNIYWEAPKKALLGLTIIEQGPNGAGNSFHIGQESKIEEVIINGKTAVIIRGVWQADTQKWDNPEHITLYLERGEQTYIFTATERNISIDDLIHIAESVP